MRDDLLAGPANKVGISVAVALFLAALGGWYVWRNHQEVPATATVLEPPAASAVATVEPIAHPVPAVGGTGAAPLPELNDSDKAISEAVGQAGGEVPLESFLVPENIIRHIVVTVDNLPRQKVAVDKRPITPIAGVFAAKGDELHATLDPQNFQRYAALIGALRKVDMQRIAAVYLHFYPLFQQSYQDLGYPTGYFNDRLVSVIDGLLATPQIAGPIDLVRPNVMYVFADQLLESRSAGQKILIRMGPDNAAVVKAKLSELRALITAAPPKR